MQVPAATSPATQSQTQPQPAGEPATPPPAPAAPDVSCDIAGKVTAGNLPLPGVTISAANSLTGKKVATTTDQDGSFTLSVSPKGKLVVRAELAAFAPATKEVVINAQNCHPRVDLGMTLLSRVQQQQEENAQQQAAMRMGGGRGFQNIGISADLSAFGGGGQMQFGGGSENGNGTGGLPAASFAEGPTESVAVSGNQAQSNEFMFGTSREMQDRIEEMRDRARRGEFGPGGVALQGPGGGYGGPGGFGGPGGGPGVFMIGGGRGRFNVNKLHGSLFYSVGDSVFNAAPYSLTGQPVVKPDYLQQRFGGVLGGPLRIPKIYNGGTKTFFFLSYFGNLVSNPYDAFSTVPTLAERSGDFSATTVGGSPVTIIDPLTHLPFPANQIPAQRINSAGAGLLNFIPLPNLPGTTQNFHFTTSATNDNHNVGLRLIHNFDGGGPGFGGPGGGGGRGGSRNNINLGLHYRDVHNVLTNPFPSVSGNTDVSSWDVPIGFVRSKGKLTNNLRVDFNRTDTRTSNLYAFQQNVAGNLGINGVATDPFDWGIPNFSFTNFNSLTDINPQHRVDQSFSVSDFMILPHGKHTLRWGGDYRRVQLNTRTNQDPRGSFVFTGFYSGYDLADLLLGLPQQAAVQFGVDSYYLRANVWDLFVQDEWKISGNFTLNAGLRYEYFSPYTEIFNRLVNLDVAPGFTAVQPVQPNQVGPYTGQFPASLVEPDRNNFAPRLGIAWKPLKNTVVRAGYGMNYNTTAYASMALNMAFQPPFAVTQTNIGTATTPLDLQNAFPSQPAGTTNNFAVDRNYRLGYVQLWNVDIQREFHRDLVVNIGYNGSKGTRLDIQTAPNRGPDGLLIPGVQPFIFETSLGDSILHAASVRVRKRMSHGIQIGGTYVYSKSIDNASTIGGGAVVVAQNPDDLAAERGLSSFDQRHKFTGDYMFELPFGENKRWLSTRSTAERIFGDWQWSGSLTIASGFPFTPRVLGNFGDISRGTNGTLRADLTGEPITLPNSTIQEWFNTAAFVVPPNGQFGNAGRNIIPGPPTVLVNMAIGKQLRFSDTKILEIRLQASNVFNTPQYTAIDTIVNSPTFGRVTAVGNMRQLQFVTRFRF
ncbi:MAG TPA: TonB-dependent receptor [Terriglobales bacterium]|nr:TonB-dependent receptor [Terriglobales bacterium]